MNKFVKISLSLLIVLSIVLNPFSSIFDVKAFAINPIIIEGGKFVLTKMLEGAGAYIAFYLGAEATGHTLEAIENQNRINNNALVAMQNGVGVYLASPTESLPDNPEIHSATAIYAERIDNPDLTPEQVDFANYFVNYVNNHPEEFQINYSTVHGSPDAYKPVMTTEQYEIIKNAVSDAYIDYSFRKQAVETQDKTIIEMVQNGVLPEYDFSFVGPQPSISAPVINGSAPLKKDGFLFSPPIPHTTNKFSTEAEARSYFPFDEVEIYGDDANGYTVSCYKNLYGMSRYVLYNGKLYFFTERNYVGYQYELGFGHSTAFSHSKSIYYSADGECLADVYKEGSYFSYGFALNETGEIQSGSPTTAFVNDSDFTSQIGGGTVDIPRSEIEDLIKRAHEMGLAVPDSWIEFANDGSISSVDGIELAKLQELIDAVSAGNLGFENMQEYLDLLSKLVAAGNLTATQQKTLVDNITKAITAEHTLEDVKFENSYLTVEHTGFKEAKTLVDKLPIINQSKSLLNNLFETTNKNEQYNGTVPNFSFYWDSNKDGVKEKYTLMDLSFMEQPLTNSNLADKGRFSSSMTIRQFIQSLIILIAYSLFMIKILKRIPSFLSGAGFGGDNVTTSFSHSKGGD